MDINNLPSACSRHMDHIFVYKRQKQFFAILFLTIIICLVLEIFFNGLPDIYYPKYGQFKRYVMAEATDGRRLGNCMFNYASLVGVAKTNNMTATMPQDFLLRNYFQIGAVPGGVKLLGAYKKYEEFGKRAGAYDFRTENLPYPYYGVLLRGYYQSWKYFQTAEKEVKEHFQFNPLILQEAKKYLEVHLPKMGGDRTLVGIHVRRGDMTITTTQKYGYTLADQQYIKNAMQYFKDRSYEGLTFIVCADDWEWTKANIKDDNLIFSEKNSAIVDLAILSLCDHVIMTVGSFGWWGAWLSNGTTIYYKKWPRPGSRLEYEVDKHDYFPKHWIAMT